MLNKCQVSKSSAKVMKFFSLLLIVFAWSCFSAPPKHTLDQLNKKVHLIEYVLLDIKKKSGDLLGKNQLFTDGYQYAVNELEKAKVSIAEKRFEEAEKFLEQAFVNMSYARSFIAKKSTEKKRNQLSYVKLNDAVIEYINALEETLSNKTDLLGIEQLKKAKELKSIAAVLLHKQEHREANAKIEEAYNLLIVSLTRLKDKETTIVTLDFETPKDEYLYEIKRLESYQILLKLRLANNTLAPGEEKLVNTFKDKSAVKIENAAQAADNKDYRQAILLLEAANENLKRALRMTGLTMF